MRKWMVLAGLGSLMVGCADETGTRSDGAEGFTETTVLKGANFRECMDVRAGEVFWPPSLFPVLAYGFPAIAPPYEITHLGAALMQVPEGLPGPGADCLGEAGLKVGVWVSMETPERSSLDGQGRPEFPMLAEVTIRGPLDPGPGELAAGYFEVALDPPVLVEEPGTVWIAAVNHDAGVPEGCLAGCWQTGGTAYEWIPGRGWVVQDSLPLFKVTLAHD